MPNGWDASAAAWIADMADESNFSRVHVLDAPMMARVRAGRYRTALDVGCGEGRFCRMLAAENIGAIGIDPTEALLHEARLRDPAGDYRAGRAEALDFPDETFDLVVSCVTLIDIPDIGRAIPEMVRVLRPGGALLIANLNSFFTAGMPDGWIGSGLEDRHFHIDNYLSEWPVRLSWRGIDVENWHRPLSVYMSMLIREGLALRYFDEPLPGGGDPAKAARYRRVPYFHIMEWQKPEDKTAASNMTP